MFDKNFNVIASDNTPTVVIAPNLSTEGVVIPVVAQQEYWVEVLGATQTTSNVYQMEIENIPAPVPDAVMLDANSDSGRSSSDNVTNVAPVHMRAEADLSDFAAEGITILTAAQATTAGVTPGAAVQIFVNGVAQGYADPIAGTGNTLFEINLPASAINANFLVNPPGGQWQNYIKAAVVIFDGQETLPIAGAAGTAGAQSKHRPDAVCRPAGLDLRPDGPGRADGAGAAALQRQRHGRRQHHQRQRPCLPGHRRGQRHRPNPRQKDWHERSAGGHRPRHGRLGRNRREFDQRPGCLGSDRRDRCTTGRTMSWPSWRTWREISATRAL